MSSSCSVGKASARKGTYPGASSNRVAGFRRWHASIPAHNPSATAGGTARTKANPSPRPSRLAP
eukprot:2188067-Rhodomonas_salina.1